MDKVYYLVYYFGKVGLADKMEMNYRTLIKKLKSPNYFTIDEMEKINSLYDEYKEN